MAVKNAPLRREPDEAGKRVVGFEAWAGTAALEDAEVKLEARLDDRAQRPECRFGSEVEGRLSLPAAHVL